MPLQTKEEIIQLLREALAAINAGRYDWASDDHVEDNMDELGLENVEQYADVIFNCLADAIKDPLNCYTPPQDSVSTAHPKTMGMPMHAFVVWQDRFKARIYVKFCMSEETNGNYYYHINCHVSRPKSS